MGSDSGRARRDYRDDIWQLISGLGVFFLASFVVETIVFYDGVPADTGGFVVGVAVSTVVAVPIVVGGYWLDRSDLPPERYPRIAKWVAGGLGSFLLLNLPMIAVWWPGGVPEAIAWARWAASVGAAAGLLMGFVEARAITRELAAQRATIRAEEAENQRLWLDYLNGVLRHEVLNSANVITGYSSLLLDDNDLDESVETHLERIHRQSEDMTRVIRDVRVLIEATNHDATLVPRDLSAVIADELEQLQDVHDSVAVETSVPDGVFVAADDLLSRVFANLFRNAVEHNDSDRTPAVRVTAETDDDAVRVHVADNGTGIPPHERETLFERSDNTGSDHGLGLYLVRTLVERYGGSIELTETGPDGSRFTVELPLTDPDADWTDDVGSRDIDAPDPARPPETTPRT